MRYAATNRGLIITPKYALQANIATKQAAGIAYPRTLQKKSGIPAHFSVSAV
jgi:hypothetical protein